MDNAPPRCPHRVAAVISLFAMLASACSGTSTPAESGTTSAKPRAEVGAPGNGADQDPLRVRYEATKRTFATMQARGELAAGALDAVLYTAEDARDIMPDIGNCPDDANCAFDLVNCMSGGDYLPAGSDGEAVDWVELHLASTAFDVLRLEHLLREQRYPEAIWRPVLKRYEDDTLQTLRSRPPDSDSFEAYTENETRLQEALVRSLTTYRAQSDSSLLLPVVEGGCGAGEMGVQIATDPPGGAAEFIPVFHYRLCGVRGLDPDDTRACDHWREPAEGMLFDVAGDYRYRVRWQDGHVSSGKLSFTNLEEGQTVTLRRR